MFRAIGVDSFDALLEAIPEQLRINGLLDIPEPVSEIEMKALAKTIAKQNRSTEDTVSFLGGGAYEHYIPAIVDFLIFRSEFYTAYTPYQPEVSQGTLQAMYEYQSMICALTGMEVSNASLYDGGSGLGEAALMAVRVTGHDSIVISETVNPLYREIVHSYCAAQGIEVLSVPAKGGITGRQALESVVDRETGGVVVQSPNYFGHIEPLEQIRAVIREQAPTAVYVVSANPLSLGVLNPPAAADADIVVAEGQGLGNHQGFGGPYLGVMALKDQFIRKMPGRLVGATVDADEKRGFVLVLKTREQDIRREKATSNICTNQGLNALAATVYMSSLGKAGIRQVANLCTQKAHYLARHLTETTAANLAYTHPFFNEFVLDLPIPAGEVISRMLQMNIFAGIDLGKKYPGMENRLLVAVTEKRTREELDAYVAALTQVLKVTQPVSAS